MRFRFLRAPDGGLSDKVIAALIFVGTLGLLWPHVQPYMPTLHAAWFEGPMVGGDEPTVLHAAAMMARGQVIYRDFFNFKGPVGLLPFVAAFLIAPAGLVVGRIAMFVVMAIFAVLLHVCARRMGCSRAAAALIALLVPLAIWPNWPYAYEGFTGQVWLLAALVPLLGHPEKRAAWMLAGAFTALAGWTTLDQGAPVLVALPIAGIVLALRERSSGAWREAVIPFALGAAAASALPIAYLTAFGAVDEAARDLLVFPFLEYRSPMNDVAYAFDLEQRLGPFSDGPTWVRWVVASASWSTALLPLVGLVAALAVGVIALAHALGVRRCPRPSTQLVLVSAFAAPFVPVLLGATRADLCHISFVETTTVLPLIALWVAAGPQPDGTYRFRWFRMVRFAGAAVAVALLVIGIALKLHLTSLPHERLTRAEVDARLAQVTGADVLAARTDPGDKIVSMRYGGADYFHARRDNGTAFSLLLPGTGYGATQWPVALDQIVERRPRLLRLGDDTFASAAAQRPELARLYEGSNGYYYLAGRVGPGLAPTTEWTLDGPARGHGLTITRQGSKAQARLDDGPSWATQVDGDKITIFSNPGTWVGTLSADGKSIAMQVFPGGPSFMASLRQPEGLSPTGNE